MNNELQTKKGFTLVELLVAVGLLAMMIAFASLIFNVSIDSHRTAVANAEIMQKLRAITDQLNADFKGQIQRPHGKIGFGFGYSDINGEQVRVRSDGIMFFANGDFQSTNQYDSGGSDKTVVGNVAAIFYGLAESPAGTVQKPREKILVRRQTIFTADPALDNFDLNSDPCEYCNTMSLAQLTAKQSTDPCVPQIGKLAERPELDPNNTSDLVMYMAKGVDNFTIQYVGSEDPDRDKDFNKWRPEDSEVEGWPDKLIPTALKFTFTLYDSKGLLKDGREFTHIVYLGN
jgi:prepilin-type N-terminal cleavage/methylation domain-containing protein